MMPAPKLPTQGCRRLRPGRRHAPTNVTDNKRVKSDFDAVILKHVGHYPMLECPEEFNRLLADFIPGLSE